MVYIVIPAYKAERFIGECLDAACKNDVIVLLGIDGCKDTLEKVQEIRGAYKNLRVFNYPKNMGTYMTLNALIREVPSGGIFIVFGADDVMEDGMVGEMVKNVPCISKHKGVICLTKKMYDEFGGFLPWRVEADTNLLKRIQVKYNVKILPRMFYRRRHRDQLTRDVAMRLKSPYRKRLKQITSDMLMKSQFYVEPKFNEGGEI